MLEKLLNTAMQMEREEFLGARRWERSEQRRDHANGYKAKTLSTRVGQLQIRIPQVRHLEFRSSAKALKLAIEMYESLRLTLCGMPASKNLVFSPLGSFQCTWTHYEKVRRAASG